MTTGYKQTGVDLDQLLVRRSNFQNVNTLWTWGNDAYGQLGDGTTTSRQSPGTVVGGIAQWSKISSGYEFAASIKPNGTLWTWGRNTQGQLGDGTTTARSSPVNVAGGGTWSQLSCGYSYTAAIKTDGTLWTWGYNSFGNLGDGSTTSRSSPGTVAGGGTTWSQVACGHYHTAAIKTDGTLWTWGSDAYGQLGDGTTTSRSSPGTVAGGGTNWSQVSCGAIHTAAIKTDGTLWTSGYNSSGALGSGTTIARSSFGTVAGGGTNWSQVSCGSTHTAAIKTDGTLWTCGYNHYGQQGDGTTSNRSSPGTVAGGGTTWSKVAGGWNHSAAIKTDGTLWTWGYNFYGGLGDGTTTSRSSPGTVAGGGITWGQVSLGAGHSIALQTTNYL